MHLALAGAIALIALLIGIGTVIWLLRIAFHKEKYTRERFAFAVLATFSAMAVSAASAFTHGETAIGAVLNPIRQGFGQTVDVQPLGFSDELATLLLFVIYAIWTKSVYDNWDGVAACVSAIKSASRKLHH